MSKLYLLVMFVFLTVLAFPKSVFAFWSNFRSDLRHSGTVNYSLANISPLHWTSTDLKTISSTPVVTNEGDIYISTFKGLTKLNKNGTTQWNFAEDTANGPTLDSSGNIYFSTSGCNPRLYSINKQGTLNWVYELREGRGLCGYYQSRTPVTLSADESTIYVGVNFPDRRVYAFNKDGTKRWKSSLMDDQESNISAIALDSDGNLYTGTSNSGRIFSLSSSGAIRWSNSIGSGPKGNTPVVDSNNNVYLSSTGLTGGDYIASFTSLGSLRWKYRLSGTVTGDLTIKNSTLYAADGSSLKAINSSEGSVSWSWNSPSGTLSSPIIDKNGNIYLTSNDTIYSVTPEGNLKSSFKIASGLGPPILVNDGLLLVYRNGDSGSGYLYALGTAPSIVNPVIFIPGVGGSEFKVNQDIFLNIDDGHGGIYSHAYPANEKVWVNKDEAIKFGDDDYFDILKLKPDALTPEVSSLVLTGDLTPLGYGEIDQFFLDTGYIKGTNFFVFPYDWRKDVSLTKDDLDALVELAKQKSGRTQVDIVAHSMGGLVARNYIYEASSAAKISRLIELGVPHLGAVDTIKNLLYGSWLGYDYKIFGLGIPPSEVRDNSQNMSGVYNLLPSQVYYSFYSNADLLTPVPILDNIDIDKNSVYGPLDYINMKLLISNLGSNMTAYNYSEKFHDRIDPSLNNTNGVKLFEIVGTGEPTLGQIRETWLVQWPIKLLPRREELFINGDGTVPYYSASLKGESLDLSAGATIYHVGQKHSDLVQSTGPSMQTVKAILTDSTSLPVEVKSEKIILEGKDVSIDDGELDLFDDENDTHTGIDNNGSVETNIPDTFYDSIDKTKYIFIKKKAKPLRVRVKHASTSAKINLKIRNYEKDKVIKTVLYKDLPVSSISSINFTLDPKSTTTTTIPIENTLILPTTEVSENLNSDSTPPTSTSFTSGIQDSSGTYSGSVLISLSATDASGSGVLKTEYSLDNGQNIQSYSSPFTISTIGTTTIQYSSTDNLNNQEAPQTLIIAISSLIENLITNTLSSNNTSISSNSGSNNGSPPDTTYSTSKSPSVIDPQIIGAVFKQTFVVNSPTEKAKNNDANILGLAASSQTQKLETKRNKPLNEIVVIAGAIVGTLSIGFALTLIQPSPK